jgi:PAT family beta-lactamase induction signal transducer AmpG
MGVPRVIAAAPTGYLAGAMGWSAFFVACALIALPGLLLLRWLHGRGSDERPHQVS